MRQCRTTRSFACSNSTASPARRSAPSKEFLPDLLTPAISPLSLGAAVMDNTGEAAVKPMVLLAVDDHPLIRSALREIVRGVTGEVELLEASRPEEGLALLRSRGDIDLVFLDLKFSRQSGLAYVPGFRDAAPAVPLVIYTMCED